jgi:ribonucleoside-diphosphate reductase alpha chain
MEPIEHSQARKEGLNKDLELFPQIFKITPDMKITHTGVSRLIMMERYAFKDIEKKTLKVGDLVVLTVKEDPSFPARGIGVLKDLNLETYEGTVLVDEEFLGQLDDPKEAETGMVVRNLDLIDKPLEIFYEQIAKRNARGLSDVEVDLIKREQLFTDFYNEIVSLNFVPAGRVLFGAGTGKEVTYFNCYVMPYPADSREGISDHRKMVMEIMSRGGGVGTNGSTLRPKSSLARGVNGKSSGSVSWLDDIAKLTHLVEQGGSRRGAQMMMLADWHPDIIEFIISKMQNPRILQFIIKTTNDKEIERMAKNKLKFIPYTDVEMRIFKAALNDLFESMITEIDSDKAKEFIKLKRDLENKIHDGGYYAINNPEFMTGANISVTLTKEFMAAVENDADYALRFPDTDSYDKEGMRNYNEKWHDCGDVREWEKFGNKIKTYRKIRAKELWNLINICATYSAEPGIFFIDNANDMTNARAYGQSVVATNPCGEQPLAPFSVCNLAAVNLAEMVNKETKTVDYDKLIQTVRTGVRLQDNVIDATPYFLEENKKQALGERRVGLGVMGLADMLIYCEKTYGSPEADILIDELFRTIAMSAYEESIELAKEKGSFPFLIGKTDDETMQLRMNFVSTGFVKKLPLYIRRRILDHGIRNSHLLTVAPTGSTGSMIGVATGLEPYFAFTYYRSGRLGKFMEVKADIVQEYLDNNPDADPNNLPEWFVSAMELSPEAHVDTQCIIQNWIDSSISKTVNAPKGYTVEQVEKVYERLWKGGAKGGTVYVDGSRDAQVLSLTAEDNTLDDYEDTEDKVYLVNTVTELDSTSVMIGNEVGDTCPICRKGELIDAGGCTTCSNCKAQLKCGL